MTNKNRIKCPNCGAENEYYKDICTSCKSYIRARVVNIDLWKSIWYIVESPLKVFKEIIFAEHKNYIVFLIIVMGIKFFLNSLIISNLLFKQDPLNETPLTHVFPAAAIFIALIFLLSYLFTKVLNAAGYKNIYKSVTAVLIYTFVPSVMIFAILSPIEFALFGQHWFYFNPSPVSLKQNAALILFGVEVIVYIWGCLLSIKAFTALTGNKKLSILFGFIFSVIVTAAMVFISLIYSII